MSQNTGAGTKGGSQIVKAWAREDKIGIHEVPEVYLWVSLPAEEIQGIIQRPSSYELANIHPQAQVRKGVCITPASERMASGVGLRFRVGASCMGPCRLGVVRESKGRGNGPTGDKRVRRRCSILGQGAGLCKQCSTRG